MSELIPVLALAEGAPRGGCRRSTGRSAVVSFSSRSAVVSFSPPFNLPSSSRSLLQALMPPNYRSQPPSTGPSSPPASQASGHRSPSQIYSEVSIEDPSFLSEDPSNTSSAPDDVDSLAGASPTEVEERALELLAHDTDDESPLPRFSAADIPRRLPAGSQEKEARDGAVAFLRKCVKDAESTDWMFETPEVFGPPVALDTRRGEGGGKGTVWLDEAFNIESYGSESDGSEYPVFFGDDDGGTSVGLEFMDLAPSGMASGIGGIPFLRDGEEERAGGGFGGGGRSRTGGLVRRVSEMAVM